MGVTGGGSMYHWTGLLSGNNIYIQHRGREIGDSVSKWYKVQTMSIKLRLFCLPFHHYEGTYGAPLRNMGQLRYLKEIVWEKITLWLMSVVDSTVPSNILNPFFTKVRWLPMLSMKDVATMCRTFICGMAHSFIIVRIALVMMPWLWCVLARQSTQKHKSHIIVMSPL